MVSRTTKLSRRTMFAGVGVAGAAAAVSSLIPASPGTAPGAEAAPRPAPPRGGGYTLSEHVKQYYKTTRI